MKRAVDFDGFFDGAVVLQHSGGDFFKVISGFIYAYNENNNSWKIVNNVNFNHLLKHEFVASYDPTTKPLRYGEAVVQLLSGETVRNQDGVYIRMLGGETQMWVTDQWNNAQFLLQTFVTSEWFKADDPASLEQ